MEPKSDVININTAVVQKPLTPINDSEKERRIAAKAKKKQQNAATAATTKDAENKKPPKPIAAVVEKKSQQDESSVLDWPTLPDFTIKSDIQHECSPGDFASNFNRALTAIKTGIQPTRIPTGHSGSYFVRDANSEIIAVFKPADEEPYAPMNPKWIKFWQRIFCFCCWGRQCHIPNTGYIAEVAASLVDERFQFGLVPTTRVVRLASPAFHYGAPRRGKAEIEPKLGSYQLFVKGYESATAVLQRWDREGGIEKALDATERAKFLLQFQKMTALDYIIRSTDRHTENWLIRHVRSTDELKIAAIDHGLAFPVVHPESVSRMRTFPYGWAMLPYANEPWDPTFRRQTLDRLSPQMVHALCEDVRALFGLDDSHNHMLTSKQIRLMRGQIWNLRQSLMAEESPAKLVKRQLMLGIRRYRKQPPGQSLDWDRAFETRPVDKGSGSVNSTPGTPPPSVRTSSSQQHQPPGPITTKTEQDDDDPDTKRVSSSYPLPLRKRARNGWWWMNVAGSNVGGGGAEERKAGEMSSTSSPLDLRAASTSAGKLLLPTMPSTTMPSSSTTSTSVNATSSGEPGPSSRCNECRGLRRKVEDIEKRFDGRVEDIQKQILAIGNFLCNPTGETSPSAASSSATLPTSSHSVSSTNNRKRPVADNHSAASLVHQPIPMPVQLPPAPPPPQQVQLEYPVALRPSLETCGFTPLLHLWPFMPLSQLQMMPAASPTMPMTLAEANVLQTAVNNSTRRWSSPSSVESTGPKTSDSNESATRGDPVSNDSASSSSEHVIKFNPFAAPLAIPSSSSGQQQQTPVITISTSSERKKLAADDYSKILKEKEHLNMNDIKIPVPEAIMADPNFRPLSENQIITQLVQNKKWDEMEPREAMIQLCKKLAEKRVFGPKLMANTTVAGPNHSTYNNLPCEGIIYIQDVCRRIVGPKLNNPDDFDESFREATKKLAARCRRVRHAKKSKSMMEGSIPLLRESSD